MTRTSFFHKSAMLAVKAALAGLTLATAATGMAEAQYYPAPGYYRPAPPGTGGYYPAPRPPRYYQERRGYPDDGYAVYPRRRAYGSVCVTSRGNCSIGQPVPLPAGCVCNIPGFGKKRGAVQ